MKTYLSAPLGRGTTAPVFHAALWACLGCLVATAQPDFGDFGGPPPGGPGGPPGFGPSREKVAVSKKYDRNGNGMLDAAERREARKALSAQGGMGRGPRGMRGMPRRSGAVAPTAGAKISPSDVPSAGDKPVYDAGTLRTLFLEFEDADWEKALEDFHGTDVEVPAKLTVDGRSFPDVGVHFRGMSSYTMVGAGSKRSLNLSLDAFHKDQSFGGQRTLNLLNAHEDPSFLRSVLFYDIAREYLAAPGANFVRVVINGENWGVYVNVQQFDKAFVREHFGTSKGSRWKVPGSPNGRGSLAYLGEDPEAYRGIYSLKGKEDAEAWRALIRLCRTLAQTPPDRLEAALEPMLDVDGALRFLALDNALVNNDGYWIRTSDYSLYRDEKGRFHILPQDANETFSRAGGPGFPGGRGGPGVGPGGMAGGRGGRGVFGPGQMLAPAIAKAADKDKDGKVTAAELKALAGEWFGKFDTAGAGSLSAEQLGEGLSALLPPPPGFPPPGGGPGGGRAGFGPGMILGPGFLMATDVNKDGSVSHTEWTAAFGRWAAEWDADKTGLLTEGQIADGLGKVLPRPQFGGPGRFPGGPPGTPGGMRGPGGGGVTGVELDPLIAAKDDAKPLVSKLLAVPSLRAKYLAHVREIAEKHLDWARLGPKAKGYHDLIAAAVRADTRKLESTEDFEKSVEGPDTGSTIPIRAFAEQRRAYLLKVTAPK